MKTYSLTRRLVAIVLVVEGLCALSMASIALEHEHHTRYAAFDVMLRGRAETLFGAVQDAGGPQDEVTLDGTQRVLPKDDIYEVVESTGRVLGRSPGLPPAQATLLERNGKAISRIKLHDTHYRVLRMKATRVVDAHHADGGTPRGVLILYGSSTDHLWGEIRENLQFYAILGSLLLIASGILLSWLLHRSLLPLRELAIASSGVSVRSWKFEPPLASVRMRELSPLAHALQRLVRGLERSFVQQTQFVSDAAHELKTAVAVMKSSLQLLRLRQLNPQDMASGLSRCESDCARIESTVVQMLTLARFESDAPAAGPAVTCDANELIAQVIAEFGPVASLKKICILRQDEDGLHVGMCAESFELLLSNLVENALQHSAEESQVRICARRVAASIEVRVEDDGEGIGTESLPHVFERFYRADVSRSRNTGGTGLGLAICKALVSREGGSIAIRSDVGVGTIVTLLLPSAN